MAITALAQGIGAAGATSPSAKATERSLAAEAPQETAPNGSGFSGKQFAGLVGGSLLGSAAGWSAFSAPMKLYGAIGLGLGCGILGAIMLSD